MAIAAPVVGVVGDPPQISGGRVVTNWERSRRVANAGTLEGKAATLRIKQRRCRSGGEAVWRGHMAGAFMAALRVSGNPDVAKADAAKRIVASGEPDCARTILVVWRMIDAKLAGKPMLPEFPTKIVSTTDVS